MQRNDNKECAEFKVDYHLPFGTVRTTAEKPRKNKIFIALYGTSVVS